MSLNLSTLLRSRPRLAAALLFLIVSPLVVVAVEAAARALGMRPAFEAPLPPEQQVRRIPSFHTDEEGFFRANPKWGGWLEGQLNSDGFRGPELDEPANGRPKVMFVGDSFVWGLSASPLSHCFVDLVGASGYRVSNLGVPGTAPNQYAALTERYIEKVRPDIVIAAIYLRNDMNVDAPMIPGHPISYPTDRGWLWAYDCYGPDARPISFEEAYARSYGGDGASRTVAYVRHYFSRTIIGSRVWRLFGPIPADSGCPSDTVHYPHEHLRTLRDRVLEYGAKLEFVVIPANRPFETAWNNLDRMLEVLAEFDPKAPEGLTPEHYQQPPGEHFNNAGHRLFADFVLDLLASDGFPPVVN